MECSCMFLRILLLVGLPTSLWANITEISPNTIQVTRTRVEKGRLVEVLGENGKPKVWFTFHRPNLEIRREKDMTSVRQATKLIVETTAIVRWARPGGAWDPRIYLALPFEPLREVTVGSSYYFDSLIREENPTEAQLNEIANRSDRLLEWADEKNDMHVPVRLEVEETFILGESYEAHFQENHNIITLPGNAFTVYWNVTATLPDLPSDISRTYRFNLSLVPAVDWDDQVWQQALKALPWKIVSSKCELACYSVIVNSGQQTHK